MTLKALEHLESGDTRPRPECEALLEASLLPEQGSLEKK